MRRKLFLKTIFALTFSCSVFTKESDAVLLHFPSPDPELPSSVCGDLIKEILSLPESQFLEAGSHGGSIFELDRKARYILNLAESEDEAIQAPRSLVMKVTRNSGAGSKEGTIMHHFAHLKTEGKTAGFVSVYQHFSCGPLIKDQSDEWNVDPRSERTSMYTIMDKMDGKITRSFYANLQSNEAIMKHFDSFFFQTLFAMEVAYRQAGFVHGDLTVSNIMLLDDYITNPTTTNSDPTPGVYLFKMGDNFMYAINRQDTSGKQVRIVDFTMSSYLKQTIHCQKNHQASISRQTDLVLFTLSMLHTVPAEAIEHLRKTNRERYDLLEDLLKNILWGQCSRLPVPRGGLMRRLRTENFIHLMVRSLNAQEVYLDTRRSIRVNPYNNPYQTDDVLLHEYFRIYALDSDTVPEKPWKPLGSMAEYPLADPASTSSFDWRRS